MKPIRSYAVNVSGFPTAIYSARSSGKARALAWRDYISAYDLSFGKFMQISTVRVIADPPGIGRRVLISGKPATVVTGHGQYVHFMYDDSDDVLCSHPLDVQSLPAITLQTEKQP